jgi:hypothetical protein
MSANVVLAASGPSYPSYGGTSPGDDFGYGGGYDPYGSDYGYGEEQPVDGLELGLLIGGGTATAAGIGVGGHAIWARTHVAERQQRLADAQAGLAGANAHEAAMNERSPPTRSTRPRARARTTRSPGHRDDSTRRPATRSPRKARAPT